MRAADQARPGDVEQAPVRAAIPAYAIRNEWITADPARCLVFADTQRGDERVTQGEGGQA
jgi:hypothetical protein